MPVLVSVLVLALRVSVLVSVLVVALLLLMVLEWLAPRAKLSPPRVISLGVRKLLLVVPIVVVLKVARPGLLLLLRVLVWVTLT